MSSPLLFQAIRDSNREQLVLLLEQKHANVNQANSNGTTPLILAAQLDRTSFVEILLVKGADPSAQEKLELGGSTALHYAAKNGNREVTVLLLSNGAQATVQDKLGRTPLHTACRYGSAVIVQILLSKGAEPSSRDSSGESREIQTYQSIANTSIELRSQKDFTWFHCAPSQPNYHTTTLPAIYVTVYWLAFCAAGFTPSYWAKVKGHDECLSLLPPPQFYGSKQITDFQLVTMDSLNMTLKIPSKKGGAGKGKGKKKK
ncbi:ankyrin repeat-containing protein [Besnoitia besnoiti]|uniref:Ankyrin repeat-containing protein n=1 Tax=Besnoitia besnoiti TaxID=94643 RepID=A0A2A9MG57_BESBE|nr:ankyrin repeat-containing protein [Besnoitia besnoiti]PFH34956.1 ankyrin repeat-containing protein [Besnoitia besnoiti]